METLKAIMTRRSIRFFKHKKVSKKSIKKIINAGLVAPSAKNCKPWKFVILHNKKKDKLSELVESGLVKSKKVNWISEKITVDIKQWMKSDPKFIFKEKGKLLSPDSTIHVFRMIQESSVVILVFNKRPLSKIKGRGRIEAMLAEILSIGASMENMLLAAHSLRLGAVWIGDIVSLSKHVKKYLKLKEDLVGALIIGYPAIKIKPRKITYNREFVDFK